MFKFLRGRKRRDENSGATSVPPFPLAIEDNSNTLLQRFQESLSKGNAEDSIRIFSSFSDPNICTDLGYTALHVAAQKQAAYLIKPLINGGADTALQTHLGDCAIHIATISDQGSNVFILLECGANPNQRTKTGRTALHFAIKGRMSNITESLIRHGADVNASDDAGVTPLDMAVDYAGQPEVALLLMRGADPNARIKGNTGLHRLAAGGLPLDYFELFVQAGADTSLVNFDGERAFDVAMRMGRQDLAKLLR